MKSFQQRRGWRNIIYSSPSLFLLIILLFFFAFGVIRFFGKMRTTGENRKIAEEKVAQLQKQKETLSTEITKLNTESGKEESIRERFPVAKDGEGVIVIVEDENVPNVPKPKSDGFFSFFTNWFK